MTESCGSSTPSAEASRCCGTSLLGFIDMQAAYGHCGAGFTLVRKIN